jgi:hypothetical protein
MSRRLSKPVQDNEFPLVLAICRSAVSMNDEVSRHQVLRLSEHLDGQGQADKARVVRELLDGSPKAMALSPMRLHRSRAGVQSESLTRAVRPPVDKETAVPLAEIVWPELLPPSPPTLPVELRAAVDAVIEEWQHFERLAQLGVRPTRSALLYGLPGTGKTHLALWLAGQLGLPVVVARLDGLVSSFLGTTSRNIGHLFDFVDRYDCVLLLDEFDAVAKLRDDPQEMGEIKRVVNTILQRLDQRKPNGFTVGITNHEQLLDPAVWRRFEIQIQVPKPGLEGRIAILKTYLKPMAVTASETQFLAWLCDGMTGAEIETFVNSIKRQSALQVRQDRPFIDTCRQAASIHMERLAQNRHVTLMQSDQQVARVLADDPSLHADHAALGHLFGKSKSTVTRWLSR